MSEMRITEAIVAWLEDLEWDERPEVNEERQTSSTEFTYSLDNGLSARCFLEAVEKAGFIKFYMYFFDTKFPESKMNEVMRFTNLVNMRTPIGSLIAQPEERIIKFYTGVDVENATLEMQHIRNMVSAGLRVMEGRLPQFMAICFGGKTAEEAVEMESE